MSAYDRRSRKQSNNGIRGKDYEFEIVNYMPDLEFVSNQAFFFNTAAAP